MAKRRPTLDRLDDELELREQPLPSDAEWGQARHLGEVLFGLTPPSVLNASNVDRLIELIRAKALEANAPLARLVQQIETRLRSLGADPAKADRVSTLRSARALLAGIDASEGPLTAVQSLARAAIRTSEGAMQAALGRAGALYVSRGCHLLTIGAFLAVGLAGGFHVLYWIGFGAAALLLLVEQSLVSPRDISRVNIAFMTVNGVVGLVFGALTIADILRG